MKKTKWQTRILLKDEVILLLSNSKKVYQYNLLYSLIIYYTSVNSFHDDGINNVATGYNRMRWIKF